jgi:DNA-directed RNA polymerase specialized sigma24 family protein
MRRGSSRYAPSEVRALVEEYAAVRASADTTRRGLRCLVQMADLNRALARIPLKFWGPVLVHGLLGVPQMEAAQALRISQQALSKRYRQGLEEVTYFINGGE